MMLRFEPRVVCLRQLLNALGHVAQELGAGCPVAFEFHGEDFGQAFGLPA